MSETTDEIWLKEKIVTLHFKVKRFVDCFLTVSEWTSYKISERIH